jgi:spermidine/putrescine transport system permease protein
VIALLLLCFLYAPIAVVVVYSFNEAKFGVQWTGFTLKWYRCLADNAIALKAVKNTLLLAGLSTILATILGTMLGYGLDRSHSRFKRLLEETLYVPVFIPDIVMAVALLLFFSLVSKVCSWLQLGLLTMVLAHVTFQIPFVAIVVRARLADFDRSLEEAAHDLGANRWQTFRHVTLPLIAPGIVSGALLAFTLSLDDFVVSFFTSGAGSTTLPIYIYSSVKRGITPEVNALSTLLILASFVGTILVTVSQRNISHAHEK